LLGLTDVVSRRVRARMRPNAGSVGRGQNVRTWQSGRRALSYAVVLGIVVGSFYLAGFSPEHLGEANIAKNMLRFCRGMVPPDFAKEFVWGLGPLLVQTLAISILGTVMGMTLGGILAVPATSTLVFVHPDSPGSRSQIERGLRWSVFWAARFLLNLLRSIPDLVWVLVCILVVGIGPFAGTLAIGLHTAGVLGKLYAETLEEVQVRPVEALRALGARPLQLFVWALWPQAKSMLASYTVLRWETNLRVSAILGAVGGGGLGQAIYNNVQLGFYSRLATLLLVVCLLVMASDWIGDRVSHGAVGA
jgi:phosphonate transport system permease protein